MSSILKSKALCIFLACASTLFFLVWALLHPEGFTHFSQRRWLGITQHLPHSHIKFLEQLKNTGWRLSTTAKDTHTQHFSSFGMFLWIINCWEKKSLRLGKLHRAYPPSPPHPTTYVKPASINSAPSVCLKVSMINGQLIHAVHRSQSGAGAAPIVAAVGERD